MQKISLKKINLNKASVVFTWDDNLSRQISHIASLFNKNEFRCTFYIVPGEKDFQNNYFLGYSELAKNDYEMGSHSYTHRYMTQLSMKGAEKEFQDAANAIYKYFKQYPISFAFPHHDCNEALVAQAKKHYLETRNTLNNSKRFSIKTQSSLEDLSKALTDAVEGKYNIIFSGHSIITEEEFLSKEQGEGYEPIRISVLEDFLKLIKNYNANIEVITFAQASLKEYIREHELFNGKESCFDDNSLLLLNSFGIDTERLITLL